MPHVAQRPQVIVKSAPPPRAARLQQLDVHPFNRVVLPHRRKKRVGKPKSQNVLHRLFAQVVVNPVNLLVFEELAHQAVQRFGRRQVFAKRLFHHHAREAFLGTTRFGQAGFGQAAENRGKILLRNCQVKNLVRAGFPRAVLLTQNAGEVGVAALVVKQPLRVKAAPAQSLQFSGRGIGVGGNGLADPAAKLVVGQLAA